MSDDTTQKKTDAIQDVSVEGQTKSSVKACENGEEHGAKTGLVEGQPPRSPELDDELTRIDAELMDCVQEYLGCLQPPADPDAADDNVGEEESRHNPTQTGGDAWEGYDDSGGWRTLAGNRQVDVESWCQDHDDDDEEAPGGRHSGLSDNGSSGSVSHVARLVGVQGADAGRHLVLKASDVSIGRSVASAIVLSESSVSRQHARVERRADGYWVVDLQSGNGTYVNGERIHESRLRSGDEVCFGNGVFRFVEPDQEWETADSRSVSSGRHEARTGRSWRNVLAEPRTLYGASTMMLMLAAGLVLSAELANGWRNERLNSAFTSWLLGVENFSNNRWDQSSKALVEARAFLPSHQGSMRYLEAVRRERAASRLVDEAQAALRNDELERAWTLAIQVVGSVAYGEDAERLLAVVELSVKRRIDQVRTALRAGRIDLAKQLLESADFLALYWPEVRSAQRRLREVEKNRLRRRR